MNNKLTKEEKDMLIELIYNKQINMISKENYKTKEYKRLEELKAKVRGM